MNPTDETVIERSKGKIALMTLGAFAFVVIGIWILTLGAVDIRDGRSFRLFFNAPELAYALGVLSIVFFGSLGIFLVKSFFDKKPGLILNSDGILDNASGLSESFVPWSEVTGFDIFEMHRQKMLIVLVTDPKKYANRGNFLKRALNKANANMSGSPIYISSNSLQIGFPELVATFEKYFKKYGDPSARGY